MTKLVPLSPLQRHVEGLRTALTALEGAAAQQQPRAAVNSAGAVSADMVQSLAAVQALLEQGARLSAAGSEQCEGASAHALLQGLLAAQHAAGHMMLQLCNQLRESLTQAQVLSLGAHLCGARDPHRLQISLCVPPHCAARYVTHTLRQGCVWRMITVRR
jgi:hypothetical protein